MYKVRPKIYVIILKNGEKKELGMMTGEQAQRQARDHRADLFEMLDNTIGLVYIVPI